MLNLKKIVLHEIKKEAGVKETSIDFSSGCLNSSSPIRIDLVSKLAQTFRRRRDKIDLADIDRDQPFAEILSEYINEDPNIESSDGAFLDFSRKASIKLSELMEEAVASKGGYIIFTEYYYQQTEFIGIFLVRDTSGSIFRPVEGSIDVTSTTYADTERLAMACRINVGNYIRKAETPLMMINNNNKGVSDYFADWLGANNRETSENYTDTLLSIIRNMPLPIPQAANGDVELSVEQSIDLMNQTKKKVFDIINSDYDGNAVLNVISLQVYNDQDAINNHIHDHNIDLPTQFKVSSTALKKFIQVRAKSGQLTLQFPTGDYLHKVTFGDGNKIIIDSADIFNEVKKQIDELE